MERRKPPLLELAEGGPPAASTVTRQGYLLAALERRIDFVHRGQRFSYVFIDRLESVLAARIGKQGVDHPAGPPETGFAPADMPVHFASNALLETAGDAGGQKLAFQINPRLGSARGIVESLIQKINDDGVDAPWLIDVHPMSDEAEFWSVVKENETSITSLQLIFAAPNVLRITGSVREDIEAAKTENNASSISISVTNPKDGIKVDTPYVREAMKIISEGGRRRRFTEKKEEII